MNKNTVWTCAINNMISTAYWTILAVMFDKWWIAFFGAFFMTSYETKHQYYRVCDGCGKHSPYAETHNDALDKAKAAGWVHYVDGNKDYCPGCQMKL